MVPILRLKRGVRLSDLDPQVVLAVTGTIMPLYGARGMQEVWITSANDSAHASTSLHYAGSAVDIRTRDLPRPEVDGQRIAERANLYLGQDFDVLFEGDHIHLEYQPRR